MKLNYLLLALCLTGWLLFNGHSTTAVHAATFTVNSTADDPDADPGDGICATTAGECTLRAAIEEANALSSSEPHTIVLPVGTINLTGDLPPLPENVTIIGQGESESIIRRDSGGEYRFFTVPDGNNLELTKLALENGRVGGIVSGGAIENSGTVTITHVIFDSNYATGDGGAIVNNNTASRLTISHSTFINNHADFDGGGIRINNGTVIVENSTFTQNSTGFSGAALRLMSSGSLTVTNSTLSNNNANGNGGAFEVNFGNQSNAVFVNSTITGNSAGDTVGGLYRGIIQNSIISGNSTTTGPDDVRSISSLGHNLIGDTTDASSNFVATDLLDVDPLLGPLQDNGGATLTHSLQNNSPAIDAGDNTVCPVIDQRGETRDDWKCDIGAVEIRLTDDDTIAKTVSEGNVYSFGPTLVRANIVDDGGCLTGITVTRIDAPHPEATENIEATGRYWTLTPAGCTDGFTVTLTLPLDITPGTADKACRWDSGLSQWDCGTAANNSSETTGPAAMPNIVIRQNVEQFSDWAVGNDVGPTAVTLQSFSINNTLTLLSLWGWTAVFGILSLTLLIWARRRTIA